MIQLEHKKIGKYIMLTNKKVAQLKYSVVFMGLNTQNKKKVLIKVISKSQYESNDVLMNSFNFELDAINVLKEQNILKSIELIVTKKNIYLVLEEPQGDSIKKIVSKSGPLSEQKLISYLRKLRLTFGALEKNQVIHGNINSKSFLIYHNQVKLGYPSYVKTIEMLKTNCLGNSKSLFEQNPEKQQDYSYLPPELLLHGQISIKHDIWSLGVVMYETLFGCLPWSIQSSQTSSEMRSLIGKGKIQFPKNQNVSKEMKHLLSGCLETNLEKRFGWEDVLEHPIFTMGVENRKQDNQIDRQENQEQGQVFQWKGIAKEAKSNSTLTQ